MRFLRPALVLALFAPQQSDDPVAALKELAKKGDAAAAQKTLREGLDREIAAGMKALEENRPDKIELHLGRAAALARPYSEPYAKMLVGQILIARRQVRLEGAALVRAVADDIRAAKPYADRIAQARKDGGVRVYTDLLSSLEARAKEWSGAPPQPAAVDAEAAKWTSIKATGPALGCGTCKGAGDVLCTCKEGLVAAACRSCNGAGTVACLLSAPSSSGSRRRSASRSCSRTARTRTPCSSRRRSRGSPARAAARDASRSRPTRARWRAARRRRTRSSRRASASGRS
jgi:hypothetical protein